MYELRGLERQLLVIFNVSMHSAVMSLQQILQDTEASN